MHLRNVSSRVCLSSHSLLIETGRYQKPNPIPVDESKCLFCNGIEDELLYQNTQEYWDYVLEFGVNKVVFKALRPVDKW